MDFFSNEISDTIKEARDGLLDSVISEKIKREKPSVDDYEHVREEVLALVQYSYTEKKAILIGLMKKIVPIFPLSSTQ